MTPVQLAVIVLAGAVTYAIRASFLAAAARMVELPPTVGVVLRMIPPAALAALVVPVLLRPEGAGLDPLNAVMAGGIVAVLVSLWRRDIGLSLAAGFAVVLATQPLLG